jgi:uncharacterized membrane protein HdeD (DUF308 family)
LEIIMGASPNAPARYRGGFTFPVILIVLGIIFLLNQLVPGYGLHKTWPLILIVFGILKLVAAFQPPRPPEGPRV